MVGNVGLWASKNVGVEGSNTRLEKWRATWNANNSKTDKNEGTIASVLEFNP